MSFVNVKIQVSSVLEKKRSEKKRKKKEREIHCFLSPLKKKQINEGYDRVIHPNIWWPGLLNFLNKFGCPAKFAISYAHTKNVHLSLLEEIDIFVI